MPISELWPQGDDNMNNPYVKHTSPYAPVWSIYLKERRDSADRETKLAGTSLDAVLIFVSFEIVAVNSHISLRTHRLVSSLLS